MPSYIASYVHGEGQLGVLLELRCNDSFTIKTDEFQELARNLTMHIAASQPRYVSPSDLPAEEWEAELVKARPSLAGLGTAERQRRLVELRAHHERGYCLLKQTYVKDDKRLVEDVINEASRELRDEIIVVRYVRYDARET